MRKTANSTTPVIKPITTSLIKTDNLVSVAPKSKIAIMTGIAWPSLITASMTVKSHGGGEGIRTPDPRVANAVLCQLSYTPDKFEISKFQI